LKKIITAICLYCLSVVTTHAQTVAQIKAALQTAANPFEYVQDKLKKKFKVDTVSIFSTSNFVGLADSIAYKGKIGSVHGPFKGNKVLIKVLAKLPNTFYRVSHIVLDTSIYTRVFAEALADTIIERINNKSSNFADMAATYSADNVSAAKKGDLGWFARGAMLEALEKEIVKHKKGQVFKVWTPSGLHIVSMTENPKKDNGFALLLRVFL
jgi:parvulin-like peptidyl-prolyl isomerase